MKRKPNNLLLLGTTDLTLNIPVADPTDVSDPKVAMNALDGFSTTAPWSTTFNMPIDATTLAPTQLSEKNVVHLDDERRATMVSNLMVVLCGERETQPVVNAGALS